MGFYPVTPGLPTYTIGVPCSKKSRSIMPNGKQFKVIAKNCSVVNKYIQSAKMNGKSSHTPTFSHGELVS